MVNDNLAIGFPLAGDVPGLDFARGDQAVDDRALTENSDYNNTLMRLASFGDAVGGFPADAL